uniref:Mediator complex subunit 15 KIX domain-containing protein n=1 Tax=Setaria italica TaxID=4555 RepID=K3YK04_SETIT
MDADWRSQLQPAARNRIVNKIMETLTKHIPVPPPLPEDLIELRKIAVRFEDKMYAAASSQVLANSAPANSYPIIDKPQLQYLFFCTAQSDYLRKIALKMLAVETYTKTQHNPGNAQVSPILKPSDPGTIHNTSYVALCAIYIFALFFFPYQENDYE